MGGESTNPGGVVVLELGPDRLHQRMARSEQTGEVRIEVAHRLAHAVRDVHRVQGGQYILGHGGVLVGPTGGVGDMTDPPRSRRRRRVQAGKQAIHDRQGEVALAMTESVLRELGASAEQIDRERDRVRADLFGGDV